MNCKLLVVLTVFSVVCAETHAKPDMFMEVIKRQNALSKFKRQVLTTLLDRNNLTMRPDAFAKMKWYQVPDFVRRRLEFSKIRPKPQLETKEIFIPVNIGKNCESNSQLDHFVCIEVNLYNNSTQPISDIIIYVDLINIVSNATRYQVRARNTDFSESVDLIHLQGTLFKAKINSIIKKSGKIFASGKHEFEIVCVHKCIDSSFDNVRVFLETIFHTNKISTRIKRSIGNDNSCSNNGVMFCCKRSFKIRPIELGWNWIVHPDEIDIFYCSGQCNNFVFNNSYGNLISMLKRSKKANLSPNQLEALKSCCAPQKYTDLQIIINNPNTNSFQKIFINDLIIGQCACI